MTIGNIAAIGALSSLYSNPVMISSMQRLASMQRINRASDDAAGLSISQRLQTQSRGLDRVASNVSEFKDLIDTAEGGMNSITENLQRMRELTIKAGNAIYTPEDRQVIQDEINQLKEGIKDTVNTVRYNDMNLLDGTFQNKFATVSANGAGARISIGGMNPDALGIMGVDVTKENSTSSNLSMINHAMGSVIGERVNLGAQVNRFDHTINNVKNSAENMRASNARIMGMDYGQISRAINNLNTGRILDSYKATMFQQQVGMAGNFISMMF